MAFLPAPVMSTPTIPRARYGLFSVAEVINTNDPHIAGGGSYESSMFCSGGNVIAAAACVFPALGQVGGGPLYVTAVPAVINTDYECFGPINLAEFQAEATKALVANQERLLSAGLFEAIFPPGTASTVALTSATPVDALAALEGLARLYYSGQPTIHAAANLVSVLTASNVVRPAGDHLETVSGARVHPIANLDTTVMYLTGALTIWKGPNKVLDPVAATTNGQYTNTFRTVSLSAVAVANDCGIFFKVTGIASGSKVPGATGVTAGSPATLAPGGVTAPYDLGDLSADPVIGNTGSAKPAATPWTAGQYLVLGDGSRVTWTGTAWALWNAPIAAPTKATTKAYDTFAADAGITAQTSAMAMKLDSLGYLASPTAAWGQGQYMTVGTYRFYWNGTSWRPGSVCSPSLAEAQPVVPSSGVGPWATLAALQADPVYGNTGSCPPSEEGWFRGGWVDITGGTFAQWANTAGAVGWVAGKAPDYKAAKNNDVFPLVPGVPIAAGTTAVQAVAAMAPAGFVASPLTNWTVGQKVTITYGALSGANRLTTTAYWNGTAWVQGIHP